MRGSLRVGRLAGIDVEVHWSWLIVFGLVTWALGGVELRNAHASPALIWTLSAGAALVFFACVLAHELAHSLVANAHERLVDRITLFVFGGVAHLRKEPPSAGLELVVALAGPGASLALALLFNAAFLGLLLAPASWRPVAESARWLAGVNFALAVFNMLPAFPLDGGRVLRAILWMTRRDFRGATRVAAGIGQAFGYTLIALGLAALFLPAAPVWHGVQGLWLVLLGWMLVNAAQAGLRRLVLDEALRGVSMAHIMTTRVPWIDSEWPLHRAVHEALLPWATPEALVLERGAPVGLLAVADAEKVARDYWTVTPARAAMRPIPQERLASMTAMATEALPIVASDRGGPVFIVRADGVLAGMVTRQDVVQALQIGLSRGPAERRSDAYRYPVPVAPPVSLVTPSAVAGAAAPGPIAGDATPKPLDTDAPLG